MICPENYCGDTCIEMCDCPLNAYCDRRFCCRCKPGLHGVFCNESKIKYVYLIIQNISVILETYNKKQPCF